MTAMLTPDWARMMSAYNTEMNRRVYGAAATLDDAARRLPRGAFWGSIHGTLNHLLWGDTVWLSRLADGPPTAVRIADSATFLPDFPSMQAERLRLDAALTAWAEALDPVALDQPLTWYSGAMGRTVSRPLAMIVTHVFNHQTHHRGQAHAMITAAGAATGDTDLPFVLPFA